jgi:hypothetical protein
MFKIVSIRKFSAVAIAITGTMLFAGCVTNKTHNEVVAQRDDLMQENEILRREGVALAGVAIGLSAELSLAEHELGFSDNVPVGAHLQAQFPSNWELAGARAASVVRMMQAGGVPAAQLMAVSQGENQPIASNATPEGRAQNRRIDVRIRPIIKK